MRLVHPLLLSLVVLLAAAPVRGQPRLLRADLRVEPASTTTARVDAEFTIAGADRVEWLLAWFPGQNLSELAGQVNDRPVQLAVTQAPGAAQRRLRALLHEIVGVGDDAAPLRLRLSYRVAVSAGYAHRFPLPVPLAPPGGGETTVRLTVVLPEGSVALGSHFPRMRLDAGSGGRLRADLAAVPAFVHARIDGLPTDVREPDPPTDSPPAATADATAGAEGFGWNFWGFLLVAAAWCLAYFAWALATNRREAEDG